MQNPKITINSLRGEYRKHRMLPFRVAIRLRESLIYESIKNLHEVYSRETKEVTIRSPIAQRKVSHGYWEEQ